MVEIVAPQSAKLGAVLMASSWLNFYLVDNLIDAESLRNDQTPTTYRTAKLRRWPQ
jgi:hypothetical protein